MEDNQGINQHGQTPTRMLAVWIISKIPYQPWNVLFLGPRYHGHMYFQDNSGEPIRQYMMHGGNPGKILMQLNEALSKII